MSEPSNSELAVQIAHLEGKLDGYQRVVQVQLDGFREGLAAGAVDRAAIHEDIATRARDADAEHDRLWAAVNGLKLWRAWLTGGGAAVTAGAAFYAYLHH